jgi:two-component system chemotaxis response regulator CheY
MNMQAALVVDDSRSMRMILGSALEELGFEVSEAGNGREALALLASAKFPVALSLVDWDMPEMNGLELVKRLRQLPEYASMVIVMVTAQNEMERIVEALEAGANEYIMKPFDKDILTGKLELAGVQLTA